MTAPFPDFFHSDIIIDFSGDGCSRCRFQGHSTEMHVWPLELLDLADAEQMVVVFNALHESPLAMQYFLELSEPRHFRQCLGFTGTPNDLPQKPVGHCVSLS